MQKVDARKRPFLAENSAERCCAAIFVCAPLPRGPAVRPLSFSKLNLFNKHIIQQEEEEDFDYLLCGRSKSNSSSSSSCTMCFLNKFNLLIRPRLMSTKNKNRESKTRKPNPSNPNRQTQKPIPQSRKPENQKPKTRNPNPNLETPRSQSQTHLAPGVLNARALIFRIVSGKLGRDCAALTLPPQNAESRRSQKAVFSRK